MELPAYEGGTGGKFRRRPFRRPAATPYDRPPSATRGMRRLETVARSGSGWLWKLVDPASRFIAGSTSRIFSSMFRKRLSAPTEVQGSEQNCQVELYVPDAIDAPTELTPIQELDGHNQSKDFGTPGFSEIVQLLKQKKYTRAQVDHLTGLICSRTFEPSLQEPESNEKVNYGEGNEERSTSLNRKLSTPQTVNYGEGNEERSTNLNRKLSTPQTALSIPLDVAASPAEIAKAYMSSRLPKASSSALSSQGQVFQKNISSPSSGVLTPKQDDLPAVPRSVLHIPKLRNPSGVGYPTLKPRGRSSMYRMSRSPYFNVNPTLNAMISQAGEYTSSSNDGPASSSPCPPGSTSILGSRQVLKRGSSFLDSEDGSFGPIRRIRQKSGLIPSSMDLRFMPSSSSHGSSLLYLDKVDLKDPNSSEKSSSLNERKYSNTDLQNAENGDGASKFPPVPRQSSEACRKILEQLDKFAPSREEKSNIRYISMDESPSSLTTEMLNGPAHRSLDNVGTSNFTSMDVIVTSAYGNTYDFQEIEGSQSEKAPGKEQENEPSRVDSPGLKFASASNGISKQAIFNKASNPSLISPTVTTTTVPARILSQRKPAFQMSAPEDLFELDDEQNAVVVPAQSTLSIAKPDPNIVETEAPIFGMSASENPLLYPSKNINVSSAVHLNEATKKASDVSQVSANESSFRFPASTESSGLSTPAITPTMSFQSHEKLLFQNEQTLPTFMFGSRNSGANTPSPVTTAATESPIESKADLTWLGTKSQSDGLNVLNNGKSEACLLKSPEIVASSGGTDAIAFGTSTISTLSNGSVDCSSVSSLLSASTPGTISMTQIHLFSSDSKLTGASSGSPPMSTTSPVLPSSTAFSFGAAASTSAAVSVSLLSDKPISVYSDGKVAKDSPFGSSNPPSTHATFKFSSTEINSNTSLMGSATFPVLGSTPSATNSTSTPSIFSQVSSCGSGFPASTSFSSETNGIFGSTTSAQTSSIVFSSANSSFPNYSTNFGTTGGSLFGVQPAQFGSGTSLFSQSLTNQPGSGSFSSAALGSSSSSLSSVSTFGVSSSSPGFGQVPFGTTNQTAKSFGSSSGFSFTSGASNSSSSGFSFGTTAPASGVSSFGFGSSSGPVFSFTSSGSSTSAATSTPIFGMPSTSGGFSSVSPNNDQMNVEDTMADDTNQAPGPIFPTFGQPNSGHASSNFVFGSAVPSGGTSVFQFGSQQNSSTLQNPNPFQAGGGIEFNPGGSFSLGSGGGDKSARKIVKVRRDKIRRK